VQRDERCVRTPSRAKPPDPADDPRPPVDLRKCRPDRCRQSSTSGDTALSRSLEALSSGQQGWITMQEARRLFSPMDDQYAFGGRSRKGQSRELGRDMARSIDTMPVEAKRITSLGTPTSRLPLRKRSAKTMRQRPIARALRIQGETGRIVCHGYAP
jgi:hypothetical protein